MALQGFFNTSSLNQNASSNEISNNAQARINEIIGNASNGFNGLWSGNFAGFDKEGTENFKVQLNKFISLMESNITKFGNSRNFSDAFQGKVMSAVAEYSISMSELFRAYVTTLRQDAKDLDTAIASYDSMSMDLASNITSDADSIRAYSSSIVLDVEAGTFVGLGGAAGVSNSTAVAQKTANLNLNIDTNHKNIAERVADGIKSTAATVAVGFTSAISGLGKIVEKVGDGVVFATGGFASGIAWIGDKLFGTNNASKIMDNTLDFVRRDLVGEANKAFYEGTSLGRSINDASNMKYDSDTAKKITNVSETAGKIAVATAATVLTGGTAAPILLGAAYGMGGGVERYAQTVDRGAGENYNYGKAVAKGVLSGGTGALEFYGYGQLGSGIVNGAKLLKSGVQAKDLLGGIKEMAGNIGAVDKSSILKNTAKNFVQWDNIGEMASVVVDHGVNFGFGDESLKQALSQGGKELALAAGMNLGGSLLGGTLQSFTGNLKTGVPISQSGVSTSISSMNEDQFQLFMRYADTLPDEGTGKFIKKTASIYANGSNVASTAYADGYSLFRDHSMQHAMLVTDYAQKLGTNIDNINLDEAICGAMTHDYGMEGGLALLGNDDAAKIVQDQLFKSKFSDDVIDTVMDEFKVCKSSVDLDNFKTKYVTNGPLSTRDLDLAVKTMAYEGKPTALDDLEKFLVGDGVMSKQDFVLGPARSAHPLNSALDVLSNGDALPAGVDKDTVALLAMSHSKSTSGITAMDEAIQWEECIKKLDTAAQSKGISFDADRMKSLIDNPTEFERLQTEAFLVREGDAMALPVSEVAKDGTKLTKMQNGSFVQTEGYRGVNTDLEGAKARKNFEKQSIVDNYVGSGDSVTNAYSKGVHVGEQNITFDSGLNTSGGTKNYAATIKVVDANNSPYSTIDAIFERIGESNTYTFADSRKVDIIIPKDIDDSVKQVYKDAFTVRDSTGLTPEFSKLLAKSGVTDAKAKKQHAFYDNIRLVFE